MYKRIVLGYDGSGSGQKALLESREVAQWNQAELTLVAVMPPPITALGPEGGVYDARLEEIEKRRFQEILDEGVRKLKAAGLSVRGEVVVGDPVQELARAAERQGADLIIVGHRHLDGWAARWWRSSVSKALIEHAPCSVLVVMTR